MARIIVVYAEGDDVAAVGGQILAALSQRGFNGFSAPMPQIDPPDRLAGSIAGPAMAESLPSAEPAYVKRRAEPAAEPERPRAKAGEGRALIGSILASGPKSATELQRLSGVSTATMYKHLKDGPFEKVDPNDFKSPWRLTGAGVKEFVTPGK